MSDPQAAVAHQEGWEVGNTAPEDRHAPLKMDGTADLDKISKTPPKGGFGGRLIAAKGDLVTPEIRQQLGLDK